MWHVANVEGQMSGALRRLHKHLDGELRIYLP